MLFCSRRILRPLCHPTVLLRCSPKSPSSSSTTAASGDAPCSSPKVQVSDASSAAHKLDAATLEKLRIAEEIGDKAFEENTEILKKVMLRGLRALVIGIVGFVTFSVAMKRRKRAEEQASSGKNDDDPTARYLEEMRSLGFDVDGLEEELAHEKHQKSDKK